MSENNSTSKDVSKDFNAIWNIRLALGFLGLTAGLISFLSKNGTLTAFTGIEAQILAITAIAVGLTVIVSGVVVSRIGKK